MIAENPSPFHVPITAVRTTKGDTAITPYDYYSASSRTTYNLGNAVLAYLLLNFALQRLDVVLCNIIFNFVPVVTIVLNALLFGQGIALGQLLGAGLLPGHSNHLSNSLCLLRQMIIFLNITDHLSAVIF